MLLRNVGIRLTDSKSHKKTAASMYSMSDADSATHVNKGEHFLVPQYRATKAHGEH
jgi:hypothetical protein